jgi:16S rRNA processing protein RimM
MNLVRVGKVGRPHSFRGTFVVQDHSGKESVIGACKDVWIGKTPETAQSFPVESAKWAAQGWLLKLKGVDSDVWVKENVHLSLFLDRDAFPETSDDEYYVADLVGFSAIDAESGEIVGTFMGSEALAPGLGPDRWWFKVGNREVAVPAISSFVEAVDTKARTIRVRGLKGMP